MERVNADIPAHGKSLPGPHQGLVNTLSSLYLWVVRNGDPRMMAAMHVQCGGIYLLDVEWLSGLPTAVYYQLLAAPRFMHSVSEVLGRSLVLTIDNGGSTASNLTEKNALTRRHHQPIIGPPSPAVHAVFVI